LFKSIFDGSDQILYYELFVNAGSFSIDYTKVTSYDGQSLTHVVSVANDQLVNGTIYKFKYRAVNKYGNSDFSDELTVGLGSKPQKPNSVRKVSAESGLTYITLEWDLMQSQGLPITGYILLINDGLGGTDFRNVAGVLFANVNKYTVTNLVTAYNYGFKLVALNFNGESDPSDAAYFRICSSPK